MYVLLSDYLWSCLKFYSKYRSGYPLRDMIQFDFLNFNVRMHVHVPVSVMIFSIFFCPHIIHHVLL